MVCDGARFLLLARPSRGEIRLPKGHIDSDEAPAETALRETAEESGYADLEIVEDLGEAWVEFKHKGRAYRRLERYFLMKLKSPRKCSRPPHDEKQFEPFWSSGAEGLQLLTFDAEQDVLRKAIAAWNRRFDV